MADPNLAIKASTPNKNNTTQGFSPFPGQHTLNSTGLSSASGTKSHSDRVCLLFGSSITTRVDDRRLKRGSRVVINLSESGAKISDIHKFANEFCADHSGIINQVDKIVINIGTNDVKWFNGIRSSVFRKFRAPLCNIVRDLKFKFPLANITFMSMLPIRALYNYTAKTVNDFNTLLLEICRTFGCVFFDCFSDFLAPDLRDYDETLFRDKWHPNETGLRLLCRAIKCIIFGHSFSPHMGTFWHRPFYM